MRPSVERIQATYLIETPLPVEQAAATLAGEQSSGTFVAVPGETKELKQRFAARVEKITLLEKVREPSLPGAEVGRVTPCALSSASPRPGAQRTDAPYQQNRIHAHLGAFVGADFFVAAAFNLSKCSRARRTVPMSGLPVLMP